MNASGNTTTHAARTRTPRPARRRRLRRSLRGAPVLAALAAVLTATACSTVGGAEHPGSADTGTPTLQPGVTSIPPAQRQPAPQLSGTTLQGKALTLRQYAGSVLVLNIWGSWCTACRSEQNTLESTYRSDQARGVAFVGLDTRDDPTAARSYQRAFAVTYPSLQDPDESLLLRFASILPPDAVPCTAIIDRHGRIAARILGAATRSELQQQIDTVLAGP